MKLTTYVEQLKLRHTFAISRDSEDVASIVIAELEHEGIVGIGEASPSSFYNESTRTVETALAGTADWLASQSPLRFAHLLEEAAERLGSNRGALCALDLAVHDWVGKRLRLPLHAMLGLNPARLPLSTFTIGLDTLERMVMKIREVPDYPLIKIKVGRPDDMEIVRALRAETGALFRVDANCGWTAGETIEKSKELKSLGVEFIEQPIPPADLDTMEEVYAKSALPIVADESAVVPAHVPRLRGRFHGINIKLVKCGGIAQALRMVHLARTFGMSVMLGCMIESSVGVTAAGQLGALADYLDLDGAALTVNDPYEGLIFEKGHLHLPERPGLGVVRR